MASVFLPEEPLLWQGNLEGHSLPGHRVRTRLKWPCVHRCKTFFFFFAVTALPQWVLNVKMLQLLGLWGPRQCQVCRDMDCLRCRSYGPVRVFFWPSFSWWSEHLFGQSFSIAPHVQTLRGLPCLGSFSVVWCIRHIETPPRWGPAL